MKHWSVIVKLIVNGSSIFVANFVTWYIFNLSCTFLRGVGLTGVFISIILYNKHIFFPTVDKTKNYEMVDVHQEPESLSPDEDIVDVAPKLQL
eukprot:UN27622